MVLHPPVQAEDPPWTPKVDRTGNEDNEPLDANESAASLPQAEVESSDGRMFIGNWEHVESETHNQRLGDKVAGDGYLGLDESMDITTVNEQGVQWDSTNEEMRLFLVLPHWPCQRLAVLLG